MLVRTKDQKMQRSNNDVKFKKPSLRCWGDPGRQPDFSHVRTHCFEEDLTVPSKFVEKPQNTRFNLKPALFESLIFLKNPNLEKLEHQNGRTYVRTKGLLNALGR